jgi:amino acid adenylation domain-containing protein
MFEDSSAGLELNISYNRDIYYASTIHRMCTHVEQLVAAVTAMPLRAIRELDYLPVIEREQLLTVFNNTSIDISTEKTIRQFDSLTEGTVIELFEQQVAATPSHTALICGDTIYTYRSLNEAANRLADYLRKEYKIGKEGKEGVAGEVSEKGVRDVNEEGAVGDVNGINEVGVVSVVNEVREAGVVGNVNEVNEVNKAGIVGVVNNVNDEYEVSEVNIEGVAGKIWKEDIVAIQQERSAWMIISILAVLKTGAAYVPVDPSYPQARIDYMIADSGSRLVLDTAEINRFRDVSMNYSSENLTAVCDASSLAYVIYTSGSTGKPKGVMVEHRSLLNLCNWHNEQFSVTENDRATIYAGVGFDAAVWELFPYLITGACLYVIPEEIRLDISELAAWYDDHQISISFLPTQVAEQFMKMGNSSLRYLLTGGDKLKSFVPASYRVINNYGPTENTVVAASYEVLYASQNIPIGKPISNTQIYIVDSGRALTGIGITGEICISGASLARGYLNNELLTSEKFIDNPFQPGERMYLTGDYGHWQPDGNIAFTGRKDEQVKVRGYRIELGEIENVLHNCGHVQSAVVVAGMYSGSTALIAYIVPRQTFDAIAIRAYLHQQLPAYMIPAVLMEMDELPLTANGKIDRKQLPDPEDIVAEYVGPRNEVEEKLVQIWEEVLGRRGIGIRDNFFELGGHSLKVAQVISRVQQVFSIRLSIQGIFKEPTIENISEEISFLVNQHTQLLNRENLKQIEI